MDGEREGLDRVYWVRGGCPDVNGKATTSLSCRCCSSSLVQEPWKKQAEGEEAAFHCFDWTNDLHRKCTHFNTPKGG